MKYSAKLSIYRAAERVLTKHGAYYLYRELCIRRILRAGCIFIHIPKAAGTSIATATIGRRAGHYPASELRGSMGHSRYDSMFSFAVTRDPVDRAWSAYRYARNNGGTDGGIAPLPVYHSSCFRTFESFVNEWLIHQDMVNVDQIFKPQTPYIYTDGRCMVDYVGRVEEMCDVESRLTKALGRPVTIPKMNRTAQSGAGRDISAKTLDALVEVYGEDFQTLGYTIR